jgi:hypothetical protein
MLPFQNSRIPFVLTAVLWFLSIFLAGQSAFAQIDYLYVKGNQITTSPTGGCTLHLKGVDIDGLEFSPYGYGPGGSSANCGGFTGNSTNGCGGNTMQAVQEAVTAWHASIIRLPLNQDFWFGCSNSITQIAASQYQSAVSAIVGYCASQNVYVIMDLHWSGTYGGTTATTPCTGAGWGTATGQEAMADANAVTFWGSVAGTPWVKNNPAVLFDLYNEPTNALSWSTWVNGGNTTGTPSWTPGMQGLLNAVRGAGAENVCLLGGLSWCSDLTGILGNTFSNTGNGLVYSAHLYGPNDGTTPASWNADVPSSLLAAAPVFVGEFGGATTCGTDPDNPTFDSNMIGTNGWAVTTTGVVGATAWSFTDDSCPNQFSNWSWTTNPWGTAVSTWLASPYPTCPSNITLTPTPNASYTATPTFSPTITVTPTPTTNPCAQVYEAINCGGPQTIIAGVTWVADQAYATGGFGYVTAGTVGTWTNTIANSGAQQILYQSERYASNLEYKFTVPNGNYQVILKNVDSYCTTTGCRVFSVAINGVTMLTNMDIYSQVGQNAVDDHSFMVNVTGGLIDIVGTATANNAEFAAIEITSESVCTATPTPTNAYTSTFTPTATLTATKTSTATASPSNTPTNTGTSTATHTPTMTFTLSFTTTPTLTVTMTGTMTHTLTPTLTLSPTNSPAPTSTGTATNTKTPPPPASPTPTASATSTGTASFTATVSPTSTSSLTPTYTFNPTLSATVTDTFTATSTQTFTNTPPPTSTYTVTFSPTKSFTPTNTTTASMTATPSLTGTATSSKTLTPTPLNTDTSTATPTATKTLTPTFTIPWTLTATPSATPILIPTPLVLYPNPSNGQPVSVVLPGLSSNTQVKLLVFTLAFRKVQEETLTVSAGSSLVWFKPVDKMDKPLANGLYYVIMTTPGKRYMLKLLILR